MGCCLCADHNCDLAAVMEMGAIELDSFVTITFENTLYHSPYFVAIDDRTRCIVIAVRGTLSLDDTIVDLLYDGVRLEEIETFVARQTGTTPTFVGHRGMVGSARRLYQRLLADGVIETARAQRPGYSLVVCGHSLGAGIASFLTLLLRPIYPEVKGYALSAPLGMMNAELAEYTKPFLVSIVYGFDAFARMNKATVMDFKWRLIDALSVCTVPKYRILSRGAELCLGRCFLRCCSPCCFPKNFADRTVGRDTFLLDQETQDRLINPNPELPRWDPVSARATPTEQGDAAEVVASGSGKFSPLCLRRHLFHHCLISTSSN
ncbi:unnamed protein product [Echinostoma caproni]|uniref:sn-1-specific diacylglycerol lipase n=1 Tax=Echinostoma caproni TaxID=27848 RepID=A0A183B8N3_9TREM|nr:unnamed protein product [Echinostoma caproni]